MLRSNSHSARRLTRHLNLEVLETRQLFTVNMSAEAQLLLELVNRARADPVAEIERTLAADRQDIDVSADDLVTDLNQDLAEDETISADPKQPLAPHQSLIDAMEGHLLDMLARNYFAHDSPEGSTPSTRARAAGYPTGAGENIAWAGKTDGIRRTEEVYKRHRGLVRSTGHRINMMRERWREIGPGIEYGRFRQEFRNFDSIMAGTLFGNRSGNNFITGVAISDRIIRNNFYEVGEGLGSVRITATRLGTSDQYTVLTGTSGGYGLQVPDGTYNITATGINLPHTLVVRGVVVDGQNVKVDFNTSGMLTRYISGRVFEDVNANRVRDSNDRDLEGRTVYIDANNNGEFDSNELNVQTDRSGSYFLSGLLPGQYTVRQVLERDWIQTLPFGTYDVPLGTQNIIGVDFATVLLNELPVAGEDAADTIGQRPVTIDVLHNDADPDGAVDPDTLRVSRIPRNGTVAVSPDNQLIYTAREGYSGTDTFSYTVDDDRGGRSDATNVTVSVTRALPFQNDENPFDVDANGFVVSLDVLIVVNELNRHGARSLANVTRTGSMHYYDVSGDEHISSLDALRIIQFINRNPASGEPDDAVDNDQTALQANLSAITSIQSQDAVFAAFASQDDDDSNQRQFFDD